MVAVPPRDVTGEWSEHVEKAPGDDHVVIDAGERWDSEHAPTDTCIHQLGYYISGGIQYTDNEN